MKETFPPEADHEIRLKRAKIRAWRRGMREMDLILGGYIDNHGGSFSVEQLNTFELLLAHRDQDLYDWVSGRKQVQDTDVTASEVALISEIRENWRVFEKNTP